MTDVAPRDFITAQTALLVRLVDAPLVPFGYGVDLVCADDIDPNGAEEDSNNAAGLARAAYRRITTTRGTLPDDLDYGRNVIEYLHRPCLPEFFLQAQGELSSELLKDDRFAYVEVTVTQTAPAELTITILITPEDPAIKPFSLTLAVTDGGVLLQEIQQS